MFMKNPKRGKCFTLVFHIGVSHWCCHTVVLCRWYSLTCKPGQNKTGYRGELEVKIGFTVRATDTSSVSGSVSELNKKARGSISSLNKVAGNIGGSLLSLGGKEKKNLARLASAVSGTGLLDPRKSGGFI